uniref:Uncharacterized protein n=1 Tax=Anguilla anguilla TaxID=7936 RepID=A0A0E9UFV8_ANGAN
MSPSILKIKMENHLQDPAIATFYILGQSTIGSDSG